MSTELKILENDSTPPDEQFLKPGLWWHTKDDRIICDLCPRCCEMKDGDRGFCFVRQNIGNQMMLTTYGRSTGFCVDPVEKKPLNHFYPGSSILSFGTAGCNLGCKFCQNWDISKSREVERLSAKATPEAIANAAAQLGCKSVAFTYNDPIIWAEYAIDTAKACHERGIKAVAVTAGYIMPEAREAFFREFDAANVDLKAFTEEFYYKVTSSHLEPVLETLRWLKHETDVWFEITNLVIPDANDSPDEIRELCDWVLENVGDEVPVHFTAFHPDFRMQDRPPTPPETLNRARDIALNTGLKYVYNGNVDDATRQSTYCPNCKKVVIERNWYELGIYGLNGNDCSHCGHRIAGHFDQKPGTWGRRRLPVNISQFSNQPNPTVDSSRQVNREKTHSQNPASAALPQKGPSPMPASVPQRLELNDEQKDQILATAEAIVVATSLNRKPSIADSALAGVGEFPVSGSFVSLKRKGRLRSCCGMFGEPVPLSQALQKAAVRAAQDDPRFPPISPSEIPHLDLEVWLLHDLERVTERGEKRIEAVQVGTHGLQIINGNQAGLLLPGVPVERQWNSEEFLNQTCIKAGLTPTAWKDDATILHRIRGDVFSRPLLANGNSADWEQPKPLFDAREFAQYAQHCRGVIETLLSGGVPPYYCTSVSDANVQGVGVIVSVNGSDGVITASRLSWKQTVPLQATIFSLCEDVSKAVVRGGLKVGDFQVHLAVADDTAMHGTVAEADLEGIDPQHRGILVTQGQRSSWEFDRNRSASELLEAAVQSAGIDQPAIAQVFSFAVQSTDDRVSIATKPTAVAGQNIRPPAVAGSFYPNDPQQMSAMLDSMLEGDAPREKWAACMVPHAGWVYSGKIAADVLKRIEFPKTIIAIGPKHTAHGLEWSVAPHQTWLLPGGNVESDLDLARRLTETIPGLELDAAAHQQEHGVEVELPIIARLAPNSRVVGIALGGGDLERCEQFAEGLIKVIRELDEPPLLLISSDMNHYASDDENRRLDALALAELDRLDPDALYNTVMKNHISMCGMLPAVIILKALQKMNRLHQAEKIGYATSADVSGDKSRVVGYAGYLLR
ncbi:MAG: AmmeMemoRadiSam system radical SAM enzyme [Planctomycetes bacterium]|nr:AmmeMemoRadiSam system radical SAM enzyme [Planctomycetota bacterium]